MNTGNYLIDSLDPSTGAALRSLLRPGLVPAREVLISQGEIIETLHFPTTAYLINRLTNSRGQTLQVTFVGSEGVSGLAPFLANAPCGWSVICQGQGEALVGSAAEIRRLAEQTLPLMRRLLELSHFYQAEAHQLAISATYDSIQARLASWLLTAFDLCRSKEIRITQEEVASHLGVQRTSVVEASGNLVRVGAIRLRRGVITLRDEEALRQRACGNFELIHALGRDLGVMPRPDPVQLEA